MNKFALGPSGGMDGELVDQTVPDGAQIIGFEVKSDKWINYFGLLWRSPSESGVISVGNVNGGGHEHQQPFETGEYITRFSGRYERYVNFLIVHTNRRTYGFGRDHGAAFDYQVPELDVRRIQVVGLFARGKEYVDAFGINVV